MSNACETTTNEACNVSASPREEAITVEPVADIYERAEDYQVVVDLPGVSNDAIEIEVEHNRLTIKAEADLSQRHGSIDRPNDRIRFQRRFRLSSAVATDAIQAALHDGVLTVQVPKAAEVKPRRIEVSTN